MEVKNVFNLSKFQLSSSYHKELAKEYNFAIRETKICISVGSDESGIPRLEDNEQSDNRFRDNEYGFE